MNKEDIYVTENIEVSVEMLEQKMVEEFYKLEHVDEEISKKFKPDSLNKEKYIIHALIEDDSLVAEDLSKIGFGTDKITINQRKNDDNDCLIGYQTLDNGFTFLGALSGFEWEYPVFFIIYWDGENLRGYVPEKGNVYNSYTQEAFGNSEDEDLEWIRDHSSEDYDDESTFKIGMLKNNDISYNWREIENDIICNIE
ncbi:MAG: hypothetical protein K0R54_576 [Clostridiaceae bacterium]|jgi:hypothetical protein|nr:hypothetical protein [Clostridiaceae bacterium]